MIGYLEQFLREMRPAFSRGSTFVWFVVIFVGFLVRSDTLGVSSIMRALDLSPESYLGLLKFLSLHSLGSRISHGVLVEMAISRTVCLSRKRPYCSVGGSYESPQRRPQDARRDHLAPGVRNRQQALLLPGTPVGVYQSTSNVGFAHNPIL